MLFDNNKENYFWIIINKFTDYLKFNLLYNSLTIYTLNRLCVACLKIESL